MPRAEPAHDWIGAMLRAGHIKTLIRPSLCPSLTIAHPYPWRLTTTPVFLPQHLQKCPASPSGTPPASGKSTSTGRYTASVAYGTPAGAALTSGSASVTVSLMNHVLGPPGRASDCWCPLDDSTAGTQVCSHLPSIILSSSSHLIPSP